MLEDGLHNRATPQRDKTRNILNQDNLGLQDFSNPKVFLEQVVPLVIQGPYGRIDGEPLAGWPTSHEVKLTRSKPGQLLYLGSIKLTDVIGDNGNARMVMRICGEVGRVGIQRQQRTKSSHFKATG